ncbi:unnamed protein product, partial [marine sediment metagenome]
VTLTGSAATNQFAGDTSAAAGGFTGIQTLTGASGDTLTGITGEAATWTQTSYEKTGSTGETLTIAGIDTFQGAGLIDTFNIDGGTIASLSGGAGADEFNISAGSVTTVSGEDDGDAINITGGTVTDIDGGAGNDVLNLDVTIGGTAAGGLGDDELNIAGITGGQTVTLTGSAATNQFAGDTSAAAGGFTGIQTLTGASGDTLTGITGEAATWTQTSYEKTGSTGETLTIAGIDTFQGAGLIDTFNIDGGTIASLSGGAGAD